MQGHHHSALEPMHSRDVHMFIQLFGPLCVALAVLCGDGGKDDVGAIQNPGWILS